MAFFSFHGFARSFTMVSVALILLLSPAYLFADDPASPSGGNNPSEKDATFVSETVVTATGRETSLRNAPAVVDVITEEDIKKMPHRNLEDLLSTLPGVFTNQPQGEGSVIPQGFTMRGISGTDRTLMLIDGQEWNSGFTTYFNYNTIPVEAIKRIEVVRGPFSSIYGGNAVAGVIQIFTKDGMGPAFATSADVNYGSFERLQSTETVSASYDDRFSIFASHRHVEVDNYLLNDDHQDVLSTENRDFWSERFHVGSSYKLTEDVEFKLSGGAFKGVTGGGIGTNLGGENEMEDDRHYLNGRGEWDVSQDLQLFFGVDYLSEQRDYRGETFTHRVGPTSYYEESYNKSGFDRMQTKLGGHYEIFDGNTVSLGGELEFLWGRKKIVDLDGELIPVNGVAGEETDVFEFNKAFYIQDDWWFLDDQFELVLGLRYDNYESFGDEVCPKGAIIWHYLETGRIKVAGGKAFRAPDINDRLSPPWSRGGTLTSISNPDLKPETIISYELSLENEFLNNRLMTRVTPFYSDATDFISSVRLVDPSDNTGRSSLTQPANVDKVEILGVETEIRGRPLPNIETWVNYQYCEARDQETDEILANNPKHRLNFGVNWHDRFFQDFMGADLSLIYRFVGEQHYTTSARTPGVLDSYSTADVKAAVDFWDEHVSLYLSVFNLFDVDEHRRGDTDYLAERNFIGGIKLKFALDDWS